MNVTASWNIWGIKFNSRTGHQIQMLGSIGFRAFFRFAGFDAEKGHGAPCLFWFGNASCRNRTLSEPLPHKAAPAERSWRGVLRGHVPSKSLSADSEIPCALAFGRTEKVGEKSDSFSRAERTRPLRPCVPLAVLRFWKHSGGMFPTGYSFLGIDGYGTTCLYFMLWKIDGHGTPCPYKVYRTPRQLRSVGSA